MMTPKSKYLSRSVLSAAIGAMLPTTFEGRRGGPDATLDGGQPIAPGPDGMTQMPGTPEELNQAIARGVEQRMAQVEERHEQQLEARDAQAAEQRVIGQLQMLIDGNPGEDHLSTAFRSEIQQLLIGVHNRGDEPLQVFVDKAKQAHTARMQVLQQRGGDGSQESPQLRRASRETDGLFDAGVFMRSLAAQVLREGEGFSGDKLSGSPELEFTQEMLDKSDWAKTRFQRLSGRSRGNQRVVPIPAFALNAPVALAETYGTDVDTRREPTFRRDALVDFFRPTNVLQALGVPMPMISNDVTLPRLSASLSAAWLTENAAISEGDLTVVEITTSPKRLGVFDTISWMLLAGGDAQFGHQPLVVSEMARAVAQAKEAAVYGGAITSGPTGIRGTTGIKASDLMGTDPTYADLLGMITALANDNLPVEMVKFAINPTIRQLLSTTQRFATGSASLLNDVAFREPMSGPANIGNFGGPMMGTIAGHPCVVTTHIPTESGGNTYLYAALWEYVWCLDYSVAFLTIDDISAAVNGRTNITVNSYHDVAVRFPAAFNVVTHDTTP